MSRHALSLVVFTIAASQLAAACHGSLYALSQRHYQNLCSDRQYAYESGFNAGVNRERLDTSWAREKCAPQVADDARDSYLQGYNEGIARAPAAVVNVNSTARADYGAESCTFSSDCGDDMSCRHWGNAGRVCMGYGGRGAPCVFSSDCLSESCRSRPGEPGRTCR